MKEINGEENIKRLLYEFLDENTSGEFKSLLTRKPLVYYFGDEFAEKFMKMRVDKNISLKSLRLNLKNFDTEKHKDYSGYLKEIKHIHTEEKLDGDVIFLDSTQVIIFNTQEMNAKIYIGGEYFLKYNTLFNIYWNKKQEA